MFSKFQSILLLILTLTTVFAWSMLFDVSKEEELKVSILDVGQGDGIFIETPTQGQVLIDGGPGKKVLSELGEVMSMRDRDIDIVIATHTDLDHIGGLVEVLKRYEVKKVIVNGFDAKTDIAKNFYQVARDKNIEIIQAEAGDRIDLGDQIFFDIVSPVPSDLSPMPEKSNEVMIMGKLIYQDDTFFFAGDVERPDEIRLAQSLYPLESDVLKVAHHGSKYSSTDLFLEKVHPGYAVISVGDHNRYGHPTQEALSRLAHIGARIFRTDTMGRITFTSRGQGIEVKKEGKEETLTK